jgi:hypothetical protein
MGVKMLQGTKCHSGPNVQWMLRAGQNVTRTFRGWTFRQGTRFLPKCVQILKPLTDLLKGGKTLEWTVSAQEAFQNAKRLLSAAAPLQHPAPNAELSLATDASDTHLGGVMQQKIRRPLATTWFFLL